MESESYTLDIRIISKSLRMGLKITQRLVVFSYRTTIAICCVFLVVQLFSLLNQKHFSSFNKFL